MKKIPEEYFTYNLQESLVLSSKAYAENIYFQMTRLCALHTALMWDDSSLGGAADPFVLD